MVSYGLYPVLMWDFCVVLGLLYGFGWVEAVSVRGLGNVLILVGFEVWPCIPILVVFLVSVKTIFELIFVLVCIKE